ncbi:MAG TPA: MarR family winged helix-turn-helix transcriptional regulator [Burkholderiales bacterium]|jgi:DNA-binding MarR family transcriptional regulator
MKPSLKTRGARPGSIARVEGLSYGDLGEHFGYLLRRAQLAGFDAFHRATERLDITPARYTALTIVGANPGLTQSALGAALGTARSGAMMVVDWMEQRGLVERRHRQDDARSWGLYLTGRGETNLRNLNRRVRANDAAFASRLAPRERAALRKLLDKLCG